MAVHIRKAGHLLQVIPAHPTVELLGPDLQCSRRVQVGGDSRNVIYEKIDLMDVREDAAVGAHIVTPAGLRNRIIRLLRSYNMAFTYEDVRPVQLGNPVWANVDDPRAGQAEILAKIATCDMGQIEAPTGDGKTWVIVQVCKMYPNARIVIVVPGISEAKNIRDRLLSVFSTLQVGQVGGGMNEPKTRITVCVKNSLQKLDLPKYDLLMYDECHTAGGDKTAKSLAYANNCKMFGFSASTELRSDNTNLLVEALFGPVIHKISYTESQQRGNVVPIVVIMRSVPTGPSCTSHRTDVVNRQCLWRNDYRNQLIAADMALFAQDNKQVLTSVFTVEHGLELMKHSKAGYTFVYANMDPDLRLRYEKRHVIKPGEHPITTNERIKLQEQFEAGTLLRVLATCWNQGVNFSHLHVLIRADGIGSDIRNIQLPGRLSRLDNGKMAGILVDYLDEWHPTLNRRALTRIRMYKKMKWAVQMPKQLGATQNGV